MFCKYCGKVASDGSKYCPECGAPLVAGGAVEENRPTEIAPSIVMPSDYDALEQVATPESVEKTSPTSEVTPPLSAEQASAPPASIAPPSQDRAFYAPPPPQPPIYKAPDASSIGYAFLCFFFPMVGLVLYLVWKEEYPLRAKSCGKGALISVILEVVGLILVAILYVFLIVALVNAPQVHYILMGLL